MDTGDTHAQKIPRSIRADVRMGSGANGGQLAGTWPELTDDLAIREDLGIESDLRTVLSEPGSSTGRAGQIVVWLPECRLVLHNKNLNR